MTKELIDNARRSPHLHDAALATTAAALALCLAIAIAAVSVGIARADGLTSIVEFAGGHTVWRW